MSLVNLHSRHSAVCLICFIARWLRACRFSSDGLDKANMVTRYIARLQQVPKSGPYDFSSVVLPVKRVPPNVSQCVSLFVQRGSEER